LVLEGLVGIAAAIVTAVWPAITALTLVYVIAAWVVFTAPSKLPRSARDATAVVSGSSY
jgi:uncharacterized membrane protein HdeD (DUF308 family)